MYSLVNLGKAHIQSYQVDKQSNFSHCLQNLYSLVSVGSDEETPTRQIFTILHLNLAVNFKLIMSCQ